MKPIRQEIRYSASNPVNAGLPTLAAFGQQTAQAKRWRDGPWSLDADQQAEGDDVGFVLKRGAKQLCAFVLPDNEDLELNMLDLVYRVAQAHKGA